jgi:D-arabinose 1-dehydrogenase-like Zn-dependent alcohol dehydrogenase
LTSLCPLPEEIGELHAAPLLCSGVIGYRALTLTELPTNEKLGIYGFGSSAHITQRKVGERRIRSVANSTREDVRNLLQISAELKLRPDVTEFDFEHLNDHLLALKQGRFVGTGVVRIAGG